MKLHRINAYVLRHLYELRASVDRKAEIFLFPVIDLLVFGLLTVYIDKLNVKLGLAGAIIGAIILWNLIYNIQRDVSFSLLDDAWSRNLYNLFSTPLTISEIIASKLIISVVKGLISGAVIVLLSAGLFHFNIFNEGPVIIFYIFNVFIFGWAFGFFTTSLILHYGIKVQALAWSLVLVIYPISGVFYPLSVLPPFLASVARLLPISYIFEGFRSIVLTGHVANSTDFSIILGLNLFYLALGIWLFVRGFHDAKDRGWFIHPT